MCISVRQAHTNIIRSGDYRNRYTDYKKKISQWWDWKEDQKATEEKGSGTAWKKEKSGPAKEAGEKNNSWGWNENDRAQRPGWTEYSIVPEMISSRVTCRARYPSSVARRAKNQLAVLGDQQAPSAWQRAHSNPLGLSLSRPAFHTVLV